MILKKKFIKISRDYKSNKKKGLSKNIYDYFVKCDNCGREFWDKTRGHTTVAKFCFKKCRAKSVIRSEITNKKTSQSLCNYYKNNIVWNKGLTKDNNSSIKQASEKNTGKKLTKEQLLKRSEIFSGKKNPFYNKKHSKKSREAMSITRSQKISEGKLEFKSCVRSTRGQYFSKKNNSNFYYDSYWELIRMKMLDQDKRVTSWSKNHGIRIPYKQEGIIKNYIPDFLIKYKSNICILEEIKGYEELSQKLLKFKALKQYCKIHNLNYRIIQARNFHKLCIDKYGFGVKSLINKIKKGLF